MPQSSREVVELHERIEAEAYRDLIDAASGELRAELGLEHHAIEDGTLFVCRAVDHIMFDRVVGLGMRADPSPEALDRIIAAFEKNQIKNWVIQLAPGADALAKLCDARGFVKHPRTWAIFSRGAEPAQKIETEVTVRELAPADRDAFANVIAKSYHVPLAAAHWAAAAIGRNKWRYFGGFSGNELIACGVLYLDHGAGWFGFGATLEGHRGKKAQQAVLAARIETARREGATILFTETGIPHEGEAGPSFKNIQRAGFKIAYERPNLKRP
jgi:hypothetical protein